MENNLKGLAIRAGLGNKKVPFIVGGKVLIRTVTFYQTGRIIGLKRAGDILFLVIEDAALQNQEAATEAKTNRAKDDTRREEQAMTARTITDKAAFTKPLLHS